MMNFSLVSFRWLGPALAVLALTACSSEAPRAGGGQEAAENGRLDSAAEGAATGEEEPITDAEAAALEEMMAGVVAYPWTWTSLTTAGDAVAIDPSAVYSVAFEEGGTLDIQADCLSTTGSYALDGTNVTIEIETPDPASCPGDSRSAQFLALLGDAEQMLPIGGQLYLTEEAAGTTLIFDAVVTTVVDLCGAEALTVRTIEDALPNDVSATLDEGLSSLVQPGLRPGPGASMLIVTPGGRYLKSIGVSDVTTCTPLAADSHFQIGSNTKMMTSAMLFQLQEEGVLSVADRLEEWLPDLAARLPYGDRITIDMLLTHTSGVHDYFDIPTADGTSIEDGVREVAMLTRAFTPDEMVELVAASGLSEFEPGEEGKWSYSNTGYLLLGLIIEEATGQSYEENLRVRIFEPLELNQTYLQPGLPEPGALPNAYFGSPFDFATSDWNASQGWSAGAVVSTPDDFAVFLDALFSGRLFDDPATLDQMLEPAEVSSGALAEGATYARGVLDNNGVLGHGGQTLGFQSEAGYLPGQGVTFVIWSNAAESNVARTIVPGIAEVVSGGVPQ